MDNTGVLLEIIEELVSEADEVKQSEPGDYRDGQLLAYATALGIIQTTLAGYDLSFFKLDFDIDKKYLL